MSEMRDAAADLKMCEAAIPGPWAYDRDTWRENTPGQQERQGNLIIYLKNDPDFEIAEVYQQTVAKFIVFSVEALPYWIRLAQWLVGENSRLKHLLGRSEKQRAEIMEGLREVCAERDRLKAELGLVLEVNIVE